MASKPSHICIAATAPRGLRALHTRWLASTSSAAWSPRGTTGLRIQLMGNARYIARLHMLLKCFSVAILWFGSGMITAILIAMALIDARYVRQNNVYEGWIDVTRTFYDGDSDVLWQARRGVGVVTCWLNRSHIGSVSTGDTLSVGDFLSLESVSLHRYARRQMPTWTRAASVGGGSSATADSMFAIEQVVGWPLPCVWRRVVIHDGIGWRSVSAPRRNSVWSDLAQRRVLVSGLAVNAAFIGSAVWGFVSFVRVIRSRWRAGRGLCGACGYPRLAGVGDSTRCSECGFLARFGHSACLRSPKRLFQNVTPRDLRREQMSRAAARSWKAWKCFPQRS